jgi:hypothetical protein
MPPRLYDVLRSQHHPTPPALKAYTLRFEIPEYHQPYMLEWSKSNLEILFDLGYMAGQRFLTNYAALL